MDAAAKTRSEALRSGVKSLARAGVADPLADARILLCAAAGIERAALLRDPDAVLERPAASAFEALVVRRASREPVSRILGRREFWGLDLAIGPAVLDPRPETETLVAAVLDGFGSRRGEPWRILDLGTGSGAILCAVLSEFPHATGVGVDRSEAACRLAQRNLASHGLLERGLAVAGHWGSAFRPRGFDAVVANPPYIETATVGGLAPEVRDHDPVLALDGGRDGLDAYRSLAPQMLDLLRSGGIAAVEVGAGQALDVRRLLALAGLARLEVRRDLAGIERVVLGFKPD